MAPCRQWFLVALLVGTLLAAKAAPAEGLDITLPPDGIRVVCPTAEERENADSEKDRGRQDAGDDTPAGVIGKTALVAAKFDYQVLSSACVFVGKGVIEEKPGEVKTDVLRVLTGPQPHVGERVLLGRIDRCPDEKVLKGEAIYCIAQIRRVLEPPEDLYEVGTLFPASQEAEVHAALERRGQYPLVWCSPRGCFAQSWMPNLADGETNRPLSEAAGTVGTVADRSRCREIVFLGDPSTAVNWLGSPIDALVALAKRSLIQRGDAVRGKILAAIEADLFRQAKVDAHDDQIGDYPPFRARRRRNEEKSREFRKLRNSIDVLGAIERAQGRRDADKLLERYLAYIATWPPGPEAVVPGPKSARERPELENEGANHALGWLLGIVDKDRLLKHYAERLVELRDEAAECQYSEVVLATEADEWFAALCSSPYAQWHVEIQRALDETSLIAEQELAVPIERMRQAKCLRTAPVPWYPRPARVLPPSPVFWCPGRAGMVRFSRDGVRMALVGDRIEVWDVANWVPCGRMESLSDFDFIGGSYRSSDGRLLAAYDPRRNVINVRSGRTDNILQSHAIANDHQWFAAAAKKDFLLRDTSDGFTISTLVGREPRAAKLPIVGKLLKAAFTPDENFLLTVEERRAPSPEPPSAGATDATPGRRVIEPGMLAAVARKETIGDTLRITLRGTTEGFPVVAAAEIHKVPVGSDFGYYQTYGRERDVNIEMAPNGKLVAVYMHRAFGKVYSLPDLTLVKDFSSMSPPAMIFSPEGRWLAVMDADLPAPRLLRTDTWQEDVPYPGHSNYVGQLCFSADGRTFSSVGADNAICVWETATMKLLRRVVPPAGYWLGVAVRAKPPKGLWPMREAGLMMPGLCDGDGRYAFCLPGPGAPPNAPARILDVATGQFVPGLTFPDEDQLFWYGTGQILHHDGIRCRRWKVPSGELLEDKPFVSRPPDFQSEQISEDGTQVWRISRRIDGSRRAAVEVFDAATVQPIRKGEIGELRYGSHQVGLVPGGKYFHRDCEIYDRETFKLVSQRHFPHIEMPGGEDVFALAFSQDGSRYAVITGNSPDYDRDFVDHSPRISTVLRVIETASGRTLYAVPLPTRRSTAVAFSPDGERLAAANDDGTIEIRNLPVLSD